VIAIAFSAGGTGLDQADCTYWDEGSGCCLIVTLQLQLVSVRGRQDDDDLVPLHEPFETALRGFNRRQVLDHLESLDGRIAMIAVDRDTALAQVAELSRVLDHLRSESELLEQLRRETENATSQVERMLQTPMVEASARIQRIMQLVEKEAAELRANAKREIVAARAHADQEIAELRASAEHEITRLRALARSETESLLKHAKRRCAQLDADSARRREVAEQDSAQAIARRNSETNTHIQSSEMRSIARLRLMLRVVGEQLTRQVSEFERNEAALRELRAQAASEVTALAALRAETTAALTTTHQLLTGAIEQVRQTMAEHPDSSVDVPIQCYARLPSQRSTEGGTVYLLNAGAEERSSPRAPS
jgi:cell division septum initiation protein DivIVA